MTRGPDTPRSARHPVQLPLALSFPVAEGAEDFLVAPCNQEAVAWLARTPNWPGPLLVLHGPSGCGKSHLARLWSKREGAQTLTPVQLADPESLLGAGAVADDHPRTAVLDDAHRLATDPAAQRGLFHLYNRCAGEGGRLLLAAPTPPAEWGIALADLASRLRGAAAIAIAPPDDETLAAVLLKHLSDRHLPPAADVVTYLVPRMERSFAAAAQLAATLDHATLARHRPLTIPLARQVLAEMERGAESEPPPEIGL